MKKQRWLDLALGLSLCVALTAGGCKSSGNGDGDGDGGMGGGTVHPGDGDGDHSGSGGSGTPPDAIYPVFTGPGLQITIDEVKVSDKGVATVEFTLADDAGRMLDREGILTEGAIAPGFILSWLGEDEDGESTQFTAYTTREKAPAMGEAETQSSTDAGGTYEKIGLGRYVYTFGTKIEINEERSHLTHTLGVYGRRAFGGKDYVDNVLHSWVPDGNEVQTIYDVVTDEACNNCHTRLEFHGGQRRGVGMCNLCHTESNSINPESGNTIDFQVMIHKIHMGSSLPSVQAGEPYYFIGYMGAREDFSEVEYPWDMRDCSKCHTGTQGERWITRPAEKPCTSCHDRTYFGKGDAPEGWEKHTGGTHDDSECGVCHGENSLEPISKSHYTSFNNPELPEVAAEIIAITNAGPGQNPNLEFEVSLDGAPHDLLTEPFSRMRMRIWGPGSDTSVALMEEFTAASECGDSIVRPCLEAEGDGFIYYSSLLIPSTAKGTFKVGLDGSYTLEGVNYPYKNPILDFVVSGDVTPRRQIVTTERCNSCHEHLAAHGGGYNEVAYCINCHIPSAYQSADEAVDPGNELLLGSINFKDMIHGIHSAAHYPAPLNDCAQCHEDGTTSLPLAAGLLSSTYGKVSCPDSQPDCAGMGGTANFPVTTTTELPPESAACTSCHNETSDRAHADSNTSAFGEACATCHGAGKGHDVASVHELSP